jgi:hypothetical protein
MLNRDGERQSVDPQHPEAIHGFQPDEMLHMHRLAGAQQHPVKDGMRDNRGRLILGRQMESPRLEAVFPTRMHEAEIAAMTDSDQKAARQLAKRVGLPRVIIGLALCIGRIAARRRIDDVEMRHQRETAMVGAPGPYPVAVAIGY